jgi:hypothetical protein
LAAGRLQRVRLLVETPCSPPKGCLALLVMVLFFKARCSSPNAAKLRSTTLASRKIIFLFRSSHFPYRSAILKSGWLPFFFLCLTLTNLQR